MENIEWDKVLALTTFIICLGLSIVNLWNNNRDS
jgi:hypothetical protein